jgi:BirA family biotin operon repressor/biotin-[acetyl-CoA-carboxylase] ligase
MTPMPEMPAGCRLVAYDTIDSTNEEARRLAAAGAAGGTFVWAREQTAGRGRRGNDWASPRGNMYLSAILRPQCDAATAAQLGFVAALALADAIAAVTGAEAAVKWPNDLLLDGRKISGILVESTGRRGDAVDWVVIGTGANIASHPACLPSAGSLSAAGYDVSVETMVAAYADRLIARVAQWRERGFSGIRVDWLDRAAGIGDAIRVRLTDRVEDGIFEDLDESGALVLVQGGRRLRITSGDVFPADIA